MNRNDKDKNHRNDCPCHHEAISRRDFLALGAAAGTSLVVPGAQAAQSIQELEGSVFVNRQYATLATPINPGDWVTVSYGGKLTFTMGEDVYRLRGGTTMKVEADDNSFVTGLRLLAGAVLGVFGRGEKTIRTRSATIGIRGTGLYIDSAPDKTYFCTCYGETEVRVPNMGSHIYKAEHHNAIMIYTPHDAAPKIHNMAGFEGHTDEELRKNESYVGRKVPFDA